MSNQEAVNWLRYLIKTDISEKDAEAINVAIRALHVIDNFKKEMALIPCKNDEGCDRKTCKGCEHHLMEPREVMAILERVNR